MKTHWQMDRNRSCRLPNRSFTQEAAEYFKLCLTFLAIAVVLGAIIGLLGLNDD